MKISPFGVEQWMNAYETLCKYNLAETCIDSLTVEELISMSDKPQESILKDIMGLKMTYGHITGSHRLRSLIAELYSHQQPDNVLVTHGAIGANALVYETLVESGDSVISVMPTYQQHYSIPESLGAEVKLLHLKEENKFLPDLNELAELIKTCSKPPKIIALNNPNNPTGALIDENMLRDIVKLASASNSWILCDEVYRGCDRVGDGYTASIADLYERGISVASMSKTYALAGLRLGWIVAPETLLKEVEVHRDYNTISVGVLDDYLAALALDSRKNILKRGRQILETNIQILDEWVQSEPHVSYVKPISGTTSLVKLHVPVSSQEFCKGLIKKYGVMYTPAEAFGLKDHIRIGFANDSVAMRAGLELTSKYIKEIL